MRNKYVAKIVFSLLFFFVSFAGQSQCAMCKATAESNDDVGGGLNAGIEYILVFPYLLLSLFAIFIFRGRLISFWKDLIGKNKNNKQSYTAKDWY